MIYTFIQDYFSLQLILYYSLLTQACKDTQFRLHKTEIFAWLKYLWQGNFLGKVNIFNMKVKERNFYYRKKK